jgi:VanZ family protein
VKNVPRNGAGVWVVYATTAAVVLSVLVAGLWPLRFHPANDVNWMVERDGIHFGMHGSVVSFAQFRLPDDEAASPCSLELWLAPDFSSASSSILAFSTPANPVQLQLIQSLDDLFVNKERADRQWRREAKHIAIVSLLQKYRSVFIDISGDSGGTSVFIDGSLRRRSSEFRLTCESLTGTLVLANSPKQYAPWQGSIFALAVYRGSLDAATIRRHYRTFSSGTAMDSADLKNALAVYNFSERRGKVIREQTKTEPDLAIPESYSILYPPFLTPAWREFAPARWYFEDLALNIAGFLPPGFFICATLFRLRGGKRSVALATVAGLLLSLTIEILQAYIPMRNSGTTDLITNTFGAGIGAGLYDYVFARRIRFKTP